MKEQLAGKDSVHAGDSADQDTIDNFQRYIILSNLKYFIFLMLVSNNS